MKKFCLTSLFKIALPVLLVGASAAITGPMLVSCSNNKSSSVSTVSTAPNYNDEATFLKAAKALHLTTMPNELFPYNPNAIDAYRTDPKYFVASDFDNAQSALDYGRDNYLVKVAPTTKNNELYLVDPNNLPDITKFINNPDPVKAFKDYIGIGPTNPIFNENKDLFEFNNTDKTYSFIDSFVKSKCWDKYPLYAYNCQKVEWVNSWEWNGFNPIPTDKLVFKMSGFKVSYWRNGEYIKDTKIDPNIAVYNTRIQKYDDLKDTFAAIEAWKKFFAKNLNKYPAVINNELWVYTQKLMFPEIFQN